MSINKNYHTEYQEKKEFNPLLWKIKKKIYNLRRYTFHIILLVLSYIAYLQFVKGGQDYLLLRLAISVFTIFLFLSIRIAFEWERAPVLRFGKYLKTRGPGIFFVIPFVDTIVDYIDCRIMVTDFSAEKILTRDSVPVFVDAIIFWMIWDAGKATLEVENYQNAVPLSAKTALRDIIGKTRLSKVLTDRDGLGKQLQKILDLKTNPWGITSLSVEIKDIILPRDLEDAMSKEAQAEREKNARIILGEAEINLAEKFSIAGNKYKNNDNAMTLRSLNLLLDAVKKEGSMILVPSDIPHLMNKGIAASIAKEAGKSRLKK